MRYVGICVRLGIHVRVGHCDGIGICALALAFAFVLEICVFGQGSAKYQRMGVDMALRGAPAATTSPDANIVAVVVFGS